MKKTKHIFLGLFYLNLSFNSAMSVDMTQWENAAQMNDADAIQTLLIQEDISSLDDQRLTSCLITATSSNNIQVVSVLLNHINTLMAQPDTRVDTLINAIASRDLTGTQAQLNQLSATNHADCRISALKKAISCEYSDMVREISRSIYDAPIREDGLWLALKEASKNTNLDIVQTILSHLKQRNVQPDYRIQVLNNALQTQNREIMNEIASMLAYWSAPEEGIYECLLSAATHNYQKILIELLNHLDFFDSHLQIKTINGVIFHDDFSADNVENLNSFFEQKVNYKQYMLIRATQEAIVLGNIKIAKILLNTGLFNVNDHGASDEPLLIHASGYTSSKEIVCELLRLGADPTIGTIYGKTALMEAALYDRVEIMRQLISSSRDSIDLANSSGETALMYAAQQGKVDALRELILNGASIDKSDNDGTTALMYAAQYGEVAALRELIIQGANITLEDGMGRTAFMHALNSASLVDFLLCATDTIDQRIEIMKILAPSVATEKLQGIYEKTLTDTAICHKTRCFLAQDLHFKKHRLNFLSIIRTINHTNNIAVHPQRQSLQKVSQVCDLTRYLTEFM